MRIIPEWISYDEEIKQLQERVAAAPTSSPVSDTTSSSVSHTHTDLWKSLEWLIYCSQFSLIS